MTKQSPKPQQYIKGFVEFYKLKFKVTPDVLIPRPETELLVDEVIRFLTNHPERSRARRGRVEGSINILDIGTGSGNIAISIAKNLPVRLAEASAKRAVRQGLSLHLFESEPLRLIPQSRRPKGAIVKIIATDISNKALKVARQNANLHGVSSKIQFITSNLLSNVPRPEDVCIIVTNLPYIPTQRIPYLDTSVKDFEPLIALDGGWDGFELYRKLFKQIKEKGWKPKLIVCEVDYTHGKLAINEAQKFFPGSNVEVKTDLAKKQRILIIRLDR